ncbi:hypothetical protein FGB62_99g15 [Gracilaria domingensis]|nr:hypothetical protein FGB62_99g15 [Gracilaria domingensis]
MERCPVNINREVGITNQYVWVCKCPPLEKIESDERAVNGLAKFPVPAEEADTLGRNEAFLRCTEERSEPLTRLCVTNVTEFDREAERIMRHCSNVALTPEEKNNTEPFSFKTKNCSTRLVPLVTQFQTGGIWLCECEQPGATEKYSFDVVVGRGNFTTDASPTDQVKELDELQRCTAVASEQLEEVCFNAPGDFDLVALHLLEACCKRARVLSDAKLQCTTLIPDDVNALKVQRDPLV